MSHGSRRRARQKSKLWRRCESKVRFDSDSRARAAAHTLLVTQGDHGLVAYPCRNCEGWHIGHQRAA